MGAVGVVFGDCVDDAADGLAVSFHGGDDAVLRVGGEADHGEDEADCGEGQAGFEDAPGGGEGEQGYQDRSAD